MRAPREPTADGGHDRPGRSGGARLTWAGHATVRIEMDGARLLTDPVLVQRVGPLRRILPIPAGVGAALDVVLISHLHRDHLDLPTLRAIDRRAPVLAPWGAGALLRGREVVEMLPGDVVQVSGVRVRATPAAHDGGSTVRGPRGLRGPRATAIGFVVEGSVSVYFAGDTDLFTGMGAIAAPLDAALLPVGGWGARLGPGHLDARRAADALMLLRPRIAVPIHWGTYAPYGTRRGAPHLRAPGRAFAAAATTVAPDVRVVVLEPGGSVTVPARTAPHGGDATLAVEAPEPGEAGPP